MIKRHRETLERRLAHLESRKGGSYDSAEAGAIKGALAESAKVASAVRDLLLNDGGLGSNCFDAVAVLRARISLKRLIGEPLTFREKEWAAVNDQAKVPGVEMEKCA